MPNIRLGVGSVLTATWLIGASQMLENLYRCQLCYKVRQGQSDRFVSKTAFQHLRTHAVVSVPANMNVASCPLISSSYIFCSVGTFGAMVDCTGDQRFPQNSNISIATRCIRSRHWSMNDLPINVNRSVYPFPSSLFTCPPAISARTSCIRFCESSSICPIAKATRFEFSVGCTSAGTLRFQAGLASTAPRSTSAHVSSSSPLVHRIQGRLTNHRSTPGHSTLNSNLSPCAPGTICCMRSYS